ncbi:hypothetical protein HD806DRAFT_480537 [Xylariaceae sp. AK1471]|nr:hypothetical protein HD806DRAFT_480537 [Xylariaceae sp. AK1471]
MPRKVRPPADPAQNRQNQQRSRARRREYLASLEARVRTFEANELQATLEMQRAAREVAWVNERLVELLAARGVSRGEVDEFLRQQRDAREDPDGATGNQASGSGSGPGSRGRTLEDAGHTMSAGDAGSSRDDLAECEDIENGRKSSIRISPTDGQNVDARTSAAGKPKSSSDTTTTEGSRALVTSCDDAASIIADFQGHGDVSHVRNVLGCGDATDCHVKNTRLFQLMDEAG